MRPPPLTGLFFALAASCFAQANREPLSAVLPIPTPAKKPPEIVVPSPDAPPPPLGVAPGRAPTEENTLKPSWETQTRAGTFVLGIPAPRGQITDRKGSPLAQTRVSYNLALDFPPSLNEKTVLEFAHGRLAAARKITSRDLVAGDDLIVKHFTNRRVVPLDIALDILPSEAETVRKTKPDGLTLRAVYQRFYPNGAMAGHIIGYAGREGRTADSPLQNNDLLWPNTKGREGLEESFDEMLNGKPGQLNISVDATGRRVAEKIVLPPLAGCNVVTTLDEELQRLTEKTLAASCKRGAIVILDPNTGDILAMASQPGFNPNAFVPNIQPSVYKALADDPNIPLLPRAFRSAYPPGSTFKVFVGLAALHQHSITLDNEFDCPHAMQIGNLTFHNWKKDNAGALNFAQALEQSCDTWFYQVGIKTGAQPVIDWATRFGMGVKTGIPLGSEADGRVPTQEYMKKVYGRKFLPGDLANFSIGQGDLLVSPLQMAQAMAAVANGGTLYQTRLVQQVQNAEGQVVVNYATKIRDKIEMEPEFYKALKKAMVQVVEGGAGTAHKAEVPGVAVAGKTGTAQWGPKKKERLAAWFAGFIPADKPKYAFAAVYEGEPGVSGIHGGTYAAPMIGKIMGEVFKDPKAKKGRPVRRPEPEAAD